MDQINRNQHTEPVIELVSNGFPRIEVLATKPGPFDARAGDTEYRDHRHPVSVAFIGEKIGDSHPDHGKRHQDQQNVFINGHSSVIPKSRW